MLEVATKVLGGADKGPSEPVINVKELHAKIGQLTLRMIFVQRARQGGSVGERKEMINRGSELRVTRQALLGIGRGSVHYCPRPVSGADLRLMELIDRLHNELLFRAAGCFRGF